MFPSFILAYHGCDQNIADAVISGAKSLEPSENDYDWLGSGIYFWEDAPQRALEWAHERKFEKPAVIGAIIDLGHCLNLTDVKQMRVLAEAYELLKESSQLKGEPLPENKKLKRALDCAVIKAAAHLNMKHGHTDFDTVKGAYIEGDPVYPNAYIFTKTHIQICVRNPKRIIGYFLPKNLD